MKKILIIDDDPNISELLEMRFQSKGYAVIKATDGIEGLVKAKDEQPDLIILDVSMPSMNGYQFAQEKRWKEEIKDIPVLILSSQTQTKELFEEIGVANFLPKPFDSQVLIGTVKECLK